MEKKMTGYPSIDKPWLRYYKDNAEEEANSIPENKTVWDVIEESLYQHIDIPALEYFGKKISRKEFIDNVYIWARAFKKLGVKEDDIVAYYGPFLPDVCYITFALNIIGACPYFLKLAISPEALAEETKDCKLAIVFDQMWDKVRNEFSKDRFEKIIILRITDALSFPKKQLLSLAARRVVHSSIPNSNKYIYASAVTSLAKDYVGEVRISFVSNRNAFITSSSGTTVGGVVKGVVATNESVLAQLCMANASGCQYFPKERCLNHFPPTAATSLNILFLLPLYKGMTIVLDPRVSEKDFYNQVTKLHVNVICNTGSAWEAFFNTMEHNMNKGKGYDFSYVRSWVVGGEGTDSRKFKKWQKTMQRAHSERGLASAYGSSEVFASACSEEVNARYNFSKPVMSVGIPFAGINIGVFDKEGKELGYNQRGELRIKSNSVMKGYYNKPDLTAKTKVNGWIHTGDLAEIDQNGFVYIYGRIKDAVMLPDGREIYLFDIANAIKEKDYIDDAIVLEKPINTDVVNLVAHIVWDSSVSEDDKGKYLLSLTEFIKQYEPAVCLNSYAIHDDMLPYSPTTLKKDKNRMSRQNDGFVQAADGEIRKIRFCDAGDGFYSVEYLTGVRRNEDNALQTDR